MAGGAESLPGELGRCESRVGDCEFCAREGERDGEVEDWRRGSRLPVEVWDGDDGGWTDVVGIPSSSASSTA